GEVEGRDLNGRETLDYRRASFVLRRDLVAQLIETQAYQGADDATRAALIRDALVKAGQWAGEVVAPTRAMKADELTLTRFGGDPYKAMPSFLKALEAKAKLEALSGQR